MADPLNSPFSLPSLPAQETEKKRKVKAKTVKGKSRKSVAPKEEGAPAIESPSWEDMNLAQSVANSPFLGTGSRDANFVEAFSANSNLNSIPSPSVFIPRVDTVSKKEAVDSLLLSKGNVGEKYWAAVSNFLNAKISKIEFESQIVSIIGKEHLHLHNDLILGIIHNVSSATENIPSSKSMARALKNSRPVGGSVLSSSFPIPGVIPAVSVESSPSQNTTPDEFDYLFNYDLSEGKNSSKLSKRKRDKSPQSQKSSKRSKPSQKFSFRNANFSTPLEHRPMRHIGCRADVQRLHRQTFTESDDFLDSKELPTYDDVHSTIDYIAVHKNNLTSVNPQASVFLRKAMEQYLSRIIRCTIEFARSNRQDLLQSGNGDNGVRFPIQLSDFAHALEENSYLMGTNQSMFLEFVAIQSGMHSSDPEYRILDM